MEIAILESACVTELPILGMRVHIDFLKPPRCVLMSSIIASIDEKFSALELIALMTAKESPSKCRFSTFRLFASSTVVRAPMPST
ncbi:hypothetical protein U1Q18_005452 [Sarracenia purpurea var. burkii]